MEDRSGTEKITINVTPVDLGRIDALVSQGVYTNRADFIRSAIRQLLQDQAGLVQDVVTRHSYTVGVTVYPRAVLEALRGDGQRLSVRVLGLMTIPKDVDPDLADAVFDDITVLGVLRASPAVMARLAPRVHHVGRGR